MVARRRWILQETWMPIFHHSRKSGGSRGRLTEESQSFCGGYIGLVGGLGGQGVGDSWK